MRLLPNSAWCPDQCKKARQSCCLRSTQTVGAARMPTNGRRLQAGPLGWLRFRPGRGKGSPAGQTRGKHLRKFSSPLLLWNVVLRPALEAPSTPKSRE